MKTLRLVAPALAAVLLTGCGGGGGSGSSGVGPNVATTPHTTASAASTVTPSKPPTTQRGSTEPPPPSISYIGQPTTTTTTPATTSTTTSTTTAPPTTTPLPPTTTTTTTVALAPFESGVLFATGSADLSDVGVAVIIDALRVSRLPENEGLAIHVDGYVDSRGGPAENLVLARDRADAVAYVIVTTWPQLAGRVIAVGHGVDDLLDPTCLGDCPQNRAVLVTASLD